MKGKNKEIKLIFIVISMLFAGFLIYPVVRLLLKSVLGSGGLTMEHYKTVMTGKGFFTALGNSFKVAGVSALVTTLIAFMLAYIIHYSDTPGIIKKLIRAVAALPMLLPTLTYGFKVTEADTFRIGNIGEIYQEDILKVAGLIKEFLQGKSGR